MRKGFVVLLATVALGLGGATRAWASTVIFNPLGTGFAGGLLIDLLDQGPGNGLSLGLSASSQPGDVGGFLYHANLSVAKLGNTVQFSQGDSGKYFTFDASLSEMVTDNSGGQHPTIQFGPPAPTGTQGYFRMYAHTNNGDDLSGKCFAADFSLPTCGETTPGILIMEATFINNVNFFGSFSPNLAAGSQNLDQFGGDNYAGQQTLSGTGGFTADMLVTFHLANYFPTLIDNTSMEFQSSSQNLPFHQANPSACFAWNSTDTVCLQAALTSAANGTVRTVGATNGLSGPNTILEVDASTAFLQPASEVPEPATLTLLGFGLLGATAARRRQLKKAKAKDTK